LDGRRAGVEVALGEGFGMRANQEKDFEWRRSEL
jgi:hypothetical protein